MDYTQVPDIELFRGCKAGDMRAYNELVDRYAPRLQQMGMRYLRDEFLVEELAMDLLFYIWERRQDIIINQSLSAYLFKAFRNMIVRQLRKAPVYTSPVDELPAHELPLATDPPDGQILAKEMEDIYRKNLAELSPQRRLVFELSRDQQLSYKAIASHTGLSINTVENYMSAALAALRKKMDNDTVLFLLALVLPIYF
ncbi:sigma-70 family RNA polymerase sigma factor [Sphingobacterium suaedae]|uniref:Sigma-70 family RNA polymerase sigma factor n=1 Tax=Sphingobacterium suaedae TaxID=1686402 RepID=A0ABW5KLW7_9SPHI